ncbi:translocation protein TolB [Reichenbachiella agarivorans]|uniref:Translocation protein TolB n=1 Tax=Reichenbachiella agarivorans TaxID=2979464 RepID=A0ABY6CTQ8_9BACT|nr:translocation protein TolB [Reichenbachiella agarivorans]UXP33254.1 translocation protein TolB [Reichenbachiella agarivorans]
MRKIVLIAYILFLTSQAVIAQYQRQNFGQNRVQYKDFDWYYYGTEDYDIHFYNQGEEYAEVTLELLKEEFEKITDLIGYAPFSKSEIFIYNSHTDLLQSNIGVGSPSFTIAGETKFVKLQVEIAYPGNMLDFKKELKYKISKMLLEDMMFGGSLTEMFQSNYLLNLPEWFINGAENYIAYGWDVTMDDYVRDYLVKKKIRKFSKLEGEMATLVGQSVWNYIAIKYGNSNLSNILNLTRIIRNTEHSVASTLGISFRQFMYEWAEYYGIPNEELDASYISPDKDDKIIGVRGKITKLTDLKLSPDGNQLAYVQNYKGKYKIIIRDIAKGKERVAMTGGYHSIDQEVSYKLPYIDWISNTQIGVLTTWYGKNYLVTYDIPTRSKQRKSLTRFNQINQIDFNDNGKLAIVSADVKGQTDLYLISMKRNAIKRLTKDSWDDLYPQFIPGTDAFVFSSNRTTDTLNITTPAIHEMPEILNLFAYDLDTTTNVLYRMTNTISNETYPVPVDDEHIYFLSDLKGINNVYSYSFKDSLYHQVSNFRTSLKQYDINPNTHDLAFLMLNDGKTKLYLNEEYNLDQRLFTPPTLRHQVKQIEYIRKKREERATQELLEQKKAEAELESQMQHEADSTQAMMDENFIDTDNYQFEDEPEEEEINQQRFSFLSIYEKIQKEPTVTGPLPYETSFTADNLVTSFVIDQLRGFGILVETQMTDALENHKFNGGFLAITDFRSGDFFAEYSYLKHTIDLHARYDRKVVYKESFRLSNQAGDQDIRQKYKLNTFTVGAALPTSVSSRFEIDGFMEFTNYYNLNPDILATRPAREGIILGSSYTYAGFKAAWVFDNTLVNGLNLFEGSRGKVSFEHHQALNDHTRSFSNFNVDLRRYQKIHRELILATRIYYGSSFGHRPKTYMLGGMDNWLFNDKENSNQTSSPLYYSNFKDNTDVLFTEFVNLRGFNYNRFNGENVLTANAELRFPVVKYFTRGTIKSNFLRNLQFIGFYDIGSAWTGVSPFNENNTVDTKLVREPGSPFEAVIKTSRNPWLQSYGFGMRTVLLGYYLRMDVARPIEDYNLESMKFYLSLGYDF